MNDPYETMGWPPSDTIIPTNGASRASAANPYKFEPSVFGAVRRYRVLVLALAILGLLAAVAYSVAQPATYQAPARLTVPLPPSANASTDAGQYLDSQVLLLQSGSVAQQAASIADSHLGANTLSPSDFSGSHSSLTVSPPTTATPGGYGASIVAVTFQGSSQRIAQVGLDSVLQAFTQANANAIRQQAQATIAGLNAAMRQGASAAQRTRLQAQEAQTLVNEQTDLAATPTAADGPVTKSGGSLPVTALIGLIAGLVVGVALAYLLAVRKRPVGPEEGSAIYGLPMIAETPAFPVADGVQPMVSDPGSPVAEGFRFAASSIERACAAHGTPLSLAFVAPRAGSGKSVMVAGLALAMAERGARLLVVDADPAARGVTAQLLPGNRATAGLEQVLSGQRRLAETVQRSPLNEAITVLGSAPTARRLAGPARARAVRAVLAEAKPSFDMVVIDAPALLEIADAAEFADMADAAIIVMTTGDRIPDHVAMGNWVRSTTAQVLGYLYNHAKSGPSSRRGPGDRSRTGQPSSRADQPAQTAEPAHTAQPSRTGR